MANQTRQLAGLLAAAGASITLVQVNPPYRPAFIARIPVLRAVCRLLPYLLSLWRAAGESDLFHVMANSGLSWHLFAAPALWIGRLRGVPVIVNYRGGQAAAFLQRSRNLVRWSMHSAAGLAVPSGFLQQVFAAHGMRSQIVPNVVDLNRFAPRKGRAQGIAHVVVARNLEAIYDNETALRAFALLRLSKPHALLSIAGSGPEEHRLRSLATELDIAGAVNFTGRLDPSGMAALYQQADVMLNPSRVDNMPNSLLEAMASGVPLVSTDVGGIPFMVADDVTALLVRPGDVTAMASACARLLDDAALWQRLSKAGIAEVQRYSWWRVAPSLAALYRSATASKQR
jgi:glycosyltransferase involved in cell wall biosynthesis